MPMQLLRELAQASLPCTLTEEDQIDRLRLLRAAGHIAAWLPPPGSSSDLIRVLAITGTGRNALASQNAFLAG